LADDFEMDAIAGFVYKTNMEHVWQDWHCRDIGLRILLARRQHLPDWNFANLSAPHWRLYQCEEPDAWVQLEKQRIPLAPDRLWLLPPDLAFSSGNQRPITQFYVHFLIRPSLVPGAPSIFSAPWQNQKESEIFSLLAATPNDWQAACRVQRLVLEALQSVPARHFLPEQADPRARHLIRLMTAEPGRPWSNTTLAGETGFHPQAMVRWFREQTGQTPRQFLLELRVREACLQLLYTPQSIEEIAAATGFCDRYHFSRVFRQIRGLSPAAYRAQRTHWPTTRRGNDVSY